MLDVREQINGSPEAYITIEPVAGHEVIIDVDYAISRDILIRGNYINVSGMEVRNSENSCIDVQGDYVNVDNMVVHHCNQHGVIFRGQYGTLQNSEVYAASWANTNNPEDLNHQSGIKVAEGENITISNNLIHENYGEGMSLRGKTIHVSGNVVYDNYAVNVYIDNGSDVTIDGNYIYGTENPVFYVEGRRQSCISVAEEYYEGWGSNLINLVVTNNIVVGCRVSFNYWGYVEGVEMPGLKGALIAHNIFWGSSDRAMQIVERPFNENIRVYNNVVQNSDNRFARFEGLTTGITADYNFWVDLIEGDGNAVIGANGPNDLSGDVGFLTPPTLSGDPNNITLAPDSPVIDAGTNLAGVSNDYFGTTRDSAPDMGAIEAP